MEIKFPAWGVELPPDNIMLTMALVTGALVLALLAALVLVAVFFTLLRIFVPRSPKTLLVHELQIQ